MILGFFAYIFYDSTVLKEHRELLLKRLKCFHRDLGVPLLPLSCQICCGICQTVVCIDQNLSPI